MPRVWKHLALITILLDAFLAANPAQAQDKVPRFETVECPFAAPATVRCGYLVVPEDRSNPASRTIRLLVAILKSRSDHPAPDPLVYLEGGPGGTILWMVGFWLSSQFLDKRDMILVEQRGTRLSDPVLSCPEIGAAVFDSLTVNLGQQEEIAREVQVAATCRDRLKGQGINLAAYNSAASAADLDDLRQVLGYDQWNLFGGSYGTRLALTAMRDYPKGIRSVILDSTYPPQVRSQVELLPMAAATFDTIFAACAGDADCSAAYPNLKTTFYDLLERLNTQPMAVNMVHPLAGQPVTLQITGGDLAGELYTALYDATAVSFVPFMIDQIDKGNRDVIEPMAREAILLLQAITWGMYYSVDCYDQAPFNPPEAVTASANAYPQLRNFLVGRSFVAICGMWGAGQGGPIENQPVQSDIPTLVLAGEFDPTTPPIWGKETADHLSQGYYYLFTGLSHGITTSSPCGMDMAVAFVDNPTAAPDSSCMAGMRRAKFVTPADVYVTPAPYQLYVGLLGRRDLGQLAILGACLTIFLAEIPLWLVSLLGWLLRSLLHKPTLPHKTPRAALAARLTGALTVILNLILAVGFMAVLQQVLASNSLLLGFGVPASAAPLFLIPPLTALLAVALAAFAFLSWKNRWWTVVGRIRYSLVTLAALAFTLWLINWSLLRL
jgi:pimeloyl-ACP methyl ester carboxylesterase